MGKLQHSRNCIDKFSSSDSRCFYVKHSSK